jgi:hypothetical protein
MPRLDIWNRKLSSAVKITRFNIASIFIVFAPQ